MRIFFAAFLMAMAPTHANLLELARALGLAAFLVATGGSPAFASESNTDCRREGGAIPANSHDQRPACEPLEFGHKGSPCRFNTDCTTGTACVKSGEVYGTCL